MLLNDVFAWLMIAHDKIFACARPEGCSGPACNWCLYCLLRRAAFRVADHNNRESSDTDAAEREACARLLEDSLQTVARGVSLIGLPDEGRTMTMADARAWVCDVLRITAAEIRARRPR